MFFVSVWRTVLQGVASSIAPFGLPTPLSTTHLREPLRYRMRGLTRATVALAERFKFAIEKKAAERKERLRATRVAKSDSDGEFVLDATADEMVEKVPHLMV
jgi:hypothetical protein